MRVGELGERLLVLPDSAHASRPERMRRAGLPGVVRRGRYLLQMVEPKRIQLVVSHKQRCVPGIHHGPHKPERRRDFGPPVNDVTDEDRVPSGRRSK